MTNLLDDTAVLIRRASMSRVKSATRPSIIKTGKKMSNKNKRRAGEKKGRDKGVKKKKKRDESATERQTKHDAESMNTHSRLSNRRLSARFSDDRRAYVHQRSSSIYDAGPKNARDRIVPLLTSDYSSHVPSYYPLCGRRASSESFL